ncbi:MAG: penicillin-binding protein 2 [Alteromonadaceae bacterium]|nr:MAG: penicillin-binding protein 2 [Alteromonadaceae bacterium]
MNWAGADHHRFKDHASEANAFVRRVIIAALFALILFSVLIARFYSLQILNHQTYVTRSDNNRIQVRPVPPNRGLIYDRHGKLLADNRPSFTLFLVREHVKDLDSTIKTLSALVAIEQSDIDNFYKLLKQRRRPFEAVPLRYRLNERDIAKIAVDKYALKGVKIAAELIRSYPEGDLFAHTVGYVNSINEREVKNFDEETYKRYRGTHSIGKIGLEKYYESTLLGDVGHEYIEINAHGTVQRIIEESTPIAGADLHLFIDIEIQRAAAKALEGHRGALVAIEVATGGILAMVSAPSYDPNLFVTGISHRNYGALNKSKDLPLLNRTIQGQYPPGSTIKPLHGLGGLQHKIITELTSVRDPGFYQLENDERKYRDWKPGGHGHRVNLHKAITQSCDIFFYDTAFRMGVDRMHAFGLNFGLGSKTRLDIPSERSGIWPSRQWKRQTRGQGWYPGNSLNMGIGQGDVLTTPLQLAVMASTIASKGKLLRPRLVKSIGGVDTPIELVSELDLPDKYWQLVHTAMRDVVHSAKGTAYYNFGRKLKNYTVAGKTGTAQVVSIAQDAKYDGSSLSERNRDHVLFIAFSSAEDPKIAIAVIVENGEKSGKTTMPVARAVFDAHHKQQAKIALQLKLMQQNVPPLKPSPSSQATSQATKEQTPL